MGNRRTSPASMIGEFELKLSDGICNARRSGLVNLEIIGVENEFSTKDKSRFNLYTGSLDDRSDAVAAFVSLARDNEWYGKLIIEEGGDNLLLKLVKEGKPEGQENVASAIGLLRRDPESVEHMIHVVTTLRAIRKIFIDPDSRLRNWRRGDPCVSNWTGVLCFSKTLDNGYLHIRELKLLNLNLSGTLSPEIRRLSYMQILLLNGNNLTGSLPEETGNLPNLNRIQIDQNHKSGPIPVSFSKLNNTKHFIPSSYGNMLQLAKLSFRNCNLQGSILDLSRTPHLTYIDLSDNNLNGSIQPVNLSHNITTVSVLHTICKKEPSPGSESPLGLLNGESLKVESIADLDLFFKRLYSYYCEKGLCCIIIKWLVELLSLAFTICFVSF
uniref:Autophagy-related protein 9 n=1 Tax=Lactuca sativa TaxID=4236 RepID=A0A9R1VCF1_LACSA|nr:hypothetical protein LSAT_V11C600337760 [Lactuca sativa]